MTKTTRNLMAAAAAAATLFGADSAVAGDGQATRIVLHVADHAQIAPAVLARAQVEVATIYARIGVEVIWATANAPESEVPRFTVVILSKDMGLKMIKRDAVADTVLGQALRGCGRAYIFTHRVREVSARHLIDFQRLLGKVVAHEVGHLLLMDGHSDFGIMQPAVQVRTESSEWFTPTQGASIRAQLAANGN